MADHNDLQKLYLLWLDTRTHCENLSKPVHGAVSYATQLRHPSRSLAQPANDYRRCNRRPGSEADFNENNLATVWTQLLKLPSNQIVWLVSVVFDGPTEGVGSVVHLRTAKGFFAIEGKEPSKKRFEIDLLHEAKTDAL